MKAGRRSDPPCRVGNVVSHMIKGDHLQMISESFRATWSPRLLSVLRIMVGLLFLEHGLAKYFGFPAPSPPAFHVMGILGLAGAIEIASGVLVAIGLFTRIAAFIASGEMAFAYFIA